MSHSNSVGIVGAGAMGSGIAQVAALAGSRVLLYDSRPQAAEDALAKIGAALQKLVVKGQIANEDAVVAISRLEVAETIFDLKPCGLIIEAIVEDLETKRTLFRNLEEITREDTLLASNTSSLSITAIAAGLRHPERVGGMHFFNPAPLMPLVEIVSGIATSPDTLASMEQTAKAWGKHTVRARSTPGFIVNRVARPYYGEALRLLNEGASDAATIDAILREAGGFRMGPFELMDLIGHDINFAVTKSVFDAFFGDPRFTPSLRQKELVDAGLLGRKSGRGFYDYTGAAAPVQPRTAEPTTFPLSVHLFGDDPLVNLLRDRLQGDAALQSAPAHADHRLAETPNCTLYRTDGRSATQRARDLKQSNMVLIDFATDSQTVRRLAITAADQAHPSALNDATGLLQQAGFQVSVIDDAPGMLVMRTVAMLANEAADAVHQGACSAADCDKAMRLGVNYPQGPLAWAEDLGLSFVVEVLDHLAACYGEDRYRVSPLLRRNALTGRSFHQAAAATAATPV